MSECISRTNDFVTYSNVGILRYSSVMGCMVAPLTVVANDDGTRLSHWDNKLIGIINITLGKKYIIIIYKYMCTWRLKWNQNYNSDSYAIVECPLIWACMGLKFVDNIMVWTYCRCPLMSSSTVYNWSLIFYV